MKKIPVMDNVFPNLESEHTILEDIGTLREAGPVGDARDAEAVLNCYLAFYSEQALGELQRKAAEQIRAVLEGRKPDYPVNTI
jgi:hypothetical protein